MLILVGSTNPVKIQAAQEAAAQFDWLTQITVLGQPTPSGVSAQPMSIDETIQGAINRAHAAFTLANNQEPGQSGLGIGIEGGLTKIALCKTGYMNICAACIYDGSTQTLGMSSNFEHPTAVIRKIIEDGLEISEAYIQLGLGTEGLNSAKQFAQGPGAVGLMTLGRVTRKDYCIQALIPAFGAFKQKNLFQQ